MSELLIRSLFTNIVQSVSPAALETAWRFANQFAESMTPAQAQDLRRTYEHRKQLLAGQPVTDFI